jgi:UDP-N-acetylmuramate dehydrogenase
VGDLAKVEVAGDRIAAGAGARLPALAAAARDAGLAGLAFAATIPGTVGGALAGNAGYAGADMASVVESVLVLGPGERCERLPREALGFSYRASSLKGQGTILGATFALVPGERAAIEADMRRLAADRRSRQPAGVPSAGCVFKNPPGHAAGRLIDEAGLKGVAVGGAAVSDVHANFIVNRGGATAADVKQLIALIVERVRDRFGVALSLEIEILPEGPWTRAPSSTLSWG